jgi:hypothetical protein
LPLDAHQVFAQASRRLVEQDVQVPLLQVAGGNAPAGFQGWNGRVAERATDFQDRVVRLAGELTSAP